MASIYAKSERQKYFLDVIFKKYEIRCNFCNKRLDASSFFRNKSGKSMDDFTVHHLDENRSNNSPENLVFAHRTCHLKYHRQKEQMVHNNKIQEILRGISSEPKKTVMWNSINSNNIESDEMEIC